MSEVRIEHDIVYGSTGGRDLLGDVFHPAPGASKRTGIVHLYGGGFTGGNRVQASDVASRLAERGYLGLCAWYRLAGEAKFPAQLRDAKAAIRYLRANASELGIDPEKLAVAGYSAGGQLALLVAGTVGEPQVEGDAGNEGVSSDVAAVLAYYPPAYMKRRPDGSEHPVMPAGVIDAHYDLASPINLIKSGFPPTLFAQSTTDALVDYEDSIRMFNKLREVGTPAEMHIFDGLSHVFDRHPEFGAVCAELCDLFLDRHVVDPREYPAFQRTVNANPAPVS